MSSRHAHFALVSLFVIGGAGLAAQQPVPPTSWIDDEMLEEKIVAACQVAKVAGTLVRAEVLAAQSELATSYEMPVTSQRRGEALTPSDVHDLLLPSCRIVGHFYLCKECDEWHFSGASGFWVDTQGAIATCAHVIAPDDSMREAFLVVADLQGGVWPVVKVMAADPLSDVCILQTTARDTAPLPLRAAVRTGERIYCLSNPDHQFGFFSEGLVARQFVRRPQALAKTGLPGQAAADLAAPRRSATWLHVTCDFCKGSSGAPIVDAFGNVVALAQSTSTVVYDETATVADTQMVFKIATPSAALMALLRVPTAAEKPATEKPPDSAPRKGN